MTFIITPGHSQKIPGFSDIEHLANIVNTDEAQKPISFQNPLKIFYNPSRFEDHDFVKYYCKRVFKY